ncbi:HTH domain-containing protein [Haloarcula halophila]|uniref:HTH domain-containing protein n=1 Tax=Haloarcula TaxID=2237 RepID=UPI0023E43A6D|nr:HTH domain-containing protein [Halomicroarcula sp. DFY41]
MPQQSTIDSANDGTTVRMTLWTRQPVCGTRTTVLDRLGQLRSQGAIDGFDVETWPDEIRLDGETTHDEIVATFERFGDWASDHGVTVEPPFETRQVSPLLGTSYRVLRLPVMVLAVYDDELAGVYPCTDGAETTTIPDFLDAYEADGGLPATDAHALSGD